MAGKKRILINRELSWLSFNERVLQEAEDSSVPLIERLRFLGIYSNNRDEFFKVRVATIRRLIRFKKELDILQGYQPAKLLNKIYKEILRQQDRFERIYTQIKKELRTNKIFIVDEVQLKGSQDEFVRNYFKSVVQPLLFPVILGNTKSFPYLKDKSIYLVIKLYKKQSNSKVTYALVEIPTRQISRFLILPKQNDEKYVMLLDDVIRYNLDLIFSIFDYDTTESYIIKITRDAELDIDDDVYKSYIEQVSKSIKNRKKGSPVRLTYDASISDDIMDMLITRMKFRKQDNLTPGGRYHNFKDFINFPALGPAALRYKQNVPLEHPNLRNQVSLFPVIRKKDVMLFFPYQSYRYIYDLLREASIDPKVESIKITLYRMAKDSIIVNALLNALKNGKSVVVVVEIQARFDEEANIFWANQLQEDGATVIFGVPGLKVHSKLFLISRKEKNVVVNYAHIGTGNFNEETALIYSDISLLTFDKRITNEVIKLFNFYVNNYKTGTYRNLLVAPWFMRNRFLQLITQEINNAKKGKPAYIIAKLNSIVDHDIINKLYQASSEGVKIKLIVRGICSLIPGKKGISENIEAISIVDKFLEHSRVFVFCNGGQEKYYISSADWMSRNLDHRSEVAIPVFDKSLQADLKKFLDIQFNENVKARVLDEKQSNRYVKNNQNSGVRLQTEFCKYLGEKLNSP
jgi:polyphosphate kinase